MEVKAPPTPVLPRRLSLVAQTVQCLREGMSSGHWTERLPGERELSEQLQVSRRTLRAALAELQRQGWLDASRRRRRRIRKQRREPRAGDLPRVVGGFPRGRSTPCCRRRC